MRIGLFGGSFNPVHNGHVAAARAFLDEVKLDKLLLIPNALPPLKEPHEADSADRLAMLEIAFADMPEVEISDYELKCGGVSYTYKTLRYFREVYPEEQIFLLIGADNLAIFEKWKEFREVLAGCTLCVVDRGLAELNRETIAEQAERLWVLYGAQIVLLHNNPLIASSSSFRAGNHPSILPVGVYAYIQEKGLYQ